MSGVNATWTNVIDNIDSKIKEHINGKLLPRLLKYTKKGSRVLEVGCGSAIDSALLSIRGRKVTSLDNSDDAIYVANKVKEKLGSKNLIVKGDALKLPFENESFDIVFSSGVVEYFKDDFRAAAEQGRVIKKGGCIIVDVPYTFSLHTLFKHFMMLRKRWGWSSYETQYTKRKLRRLVEKNGFRVVEVYYWGVDRISRALFDFASTEKGKRMPSSLKKAYNIASGPFRKFAARFLPLNIGIVARKV